MGGRVDRRVAQYLAVDPGAHHTGLAWCAPSGQPFCHTIHREQKGPADRLFVAGEIMKLLNSRDTRVVVVEDFVVRPRAAMGTNASRPLKLIGWLEALIEPSKTLLVVQHPRSRVKRDRLLSCWPAKGSHEEAAAGHLQAWLAGNKRDTLDWVRGFGERKLFRPA